jgi:hypothetical protein
MTAPPATPSGLALSSDAEKAAVLDELVVADHELAERAARSRMGDVAIADVAAALTAALLVLGQEDLAAKAGRTRWGTSSRARRLGRCSKPSSNPGSRTSGAG